VTTRTWQRAELAVRGRRGAGAVAAGALPVWLASRLAVALTSVAAARLVGGQAADQLPTFRALWDRWDVVLFTKVAQYGYLSPSYGDRTEVDFPALPLLLRVVHVAVPDWVLAGLVVSLLAGGAGAMGLWRLAADEVGPAHARDAVVFLVLFPYAVFLFAGYSEALFLGCTCWAWVAARQQRWAVAAVLAAGAAATRVLGIPFAVALAVEYGVSRWRAGHRTPGWRSLWLVLPAVPVLIFVGYLHARTGHWDTYARAMAGGWHRTLAAPWTGIRANWRFGSDPGQPSAYLWFWRAELAAVAVGVALTAVLARGRRWGEASYVAGSTLLMSCSSYLASGVRAVLVWFPLYLALARATRRHPQIRWAYCWVCAPLMLVFVVAFTGGSWVD
jgi:hypothetical protein